MSSARIRDDRGVGSVLAITMMAVLVTLTVAVGCGVAVVAAHRAAQAAADLAALAAAGALQDGRDACAAATAVATRQPRAAARVPGRGLERVGGGRQRPPGLPMGRVELPARARAGPVSEMS